ncbi:glycoside hydrolase family 3 C-terminal domain-containing protein [Nocardia thailandica]
MLEDLLGRLDLTDKLRLITGNGLWYFADAPEIGLRAVCVSDGPVGVRGPSEHEANTSAVLPSPTALAASWDEDLLRRVGRVLASEATSKGVDVVLGPTINLHRVPRGGRHFECYSEDPLLTGRVAAAYISGLQAAGVAACPKHYVANDSETDRTTIDIRVDDRVLRELYLAPFEHVVTTSQPWTLMAGYNGVNGAPMSENPLLEDPLRAEWGFDGLVMSDWGGVYSTIESATAGTDLAMPGPEPRWGGDLEDAIADGIVGEAVIDEKVRNLLRLALRVGALPAIDDFAKPPTSGLDADPSGLAREAGVQGMVLLRNEDQVLPLSTGASVALIGPGTRRPRIQGGGSAAVVVPYIVTPEQGVRAVLGDRLRQADGLHLHTGLRQPLSEEIVGSSVTWFDRDGAELLTEPTSSAGVFRSTRTVPEGSVACEVRVEVELSKPGRWLVGGFGIGDLSVRIGGEPAVDEYIVDDPQALIPRFFDPPQVCLDVDVASMRRVEVSLRCAWPQELPMFRARIGVRDPELSEVDEFDQAVEAARSSDVAVVVVGTTEAIESEGFDRDHLHLPGKQDELVAAVARANPRTIVVVNSGAPVLMPWRNDVAAILLSWFPGMEFGHALADVLFGAEEPGGRLPTTWPAEAECVPVDEVVPIRGKLAYTEGLHIGHRAYLRKRTSPAYWFGAGLGYTTWELEEFTVERTVARVRVRNVGQRAGKHVVQLYLSRPESEVDRPIRWLAGFAVVRADSGQTAEVEIAIPKRSFQHWDRGGWVTEPGAFMLQVGHTAGDIAAETIITAP